VIMGWPPLVAPLIPPAKRGGNRRHVNLREVVNGLMYILSTGCQWRAIPKDLPPRSTVFGYFARSSSTRRARVGPPRRRCAGPRRRRAGDALSRPRLPGAGISTCGEEGQVNVEPVKRSIRRRVSSSCPSAGSQSQGARLRSCCEGYAIPRDVLGQTHQIVTLAELTWRVPARFQ
jgi:transposase